MRTLLLQDWYAKDDLINASFFALAEMFADADIGFLKNFESQLPPELTERRVTFFGSRASRKQLDDLDTLIELESKIPWMEYDRIIINTRGYLKHLRTNREGPRIIVYQHDILPPLWQVDVNALKAAEAAQHLNQQEIDLEYSEGVDFTIAANVALAERLQALTHHAKVFPVAYPLIDSNIFVADENAEREYFVITPAKDLARTLHLAACLREKFVVFAEFSPKTLFRELRPQNIFYAGNLSLSDQAYYLAGAKAIICGEVRGYSHLPLAALKMGVPVIAHPTQGLAEILSDDDAGHCLTRAGSDELLEAIRRYRNSKTNRAAVYKTVQWLNKESFFRRMRQAIEKEK